MTEIAAPNDTLSASTSSLSDRVNSTITNLRQGVAGLDATLAGLTAEQRAFEGIGEELATLQAFVATIGSAATIASSVGLVAIGGELSALANASGKQLQLTERSIAALSDALRISLTSAANVTAAISRLLASGQPDARPLAKGASLPSFSPSAVLGAISVLGRIESSQSPPSTTTSGLMIGAQGASVLIASITTDMNEWIDLANALSAALDLANSMANDILSTLRAVRAHSLVTSGFIPEWIIDVAKFSNQASIIASAVSVLVHVGSPQVGDSLISNSNYKGSFQQANAAIATLPVTVFGSFTDQVTQVTTQLYALATAAEKAMPETATSGNGSTAAQIQAGFVSTLSQIWQR